MSNNTNIFQHVLQISETANCLIGDTSTALQLEDTLKQALPAALSDMSMSSEWTVAWGPAAWKSETSPPTGDDKSSEAEGAGHIVFVGLGSQVFEDGHTYPVYVVAIGITAGLSELWKEILGIDSVIDIDQWAGSGISGLGTEPTPIENRPALKDGSSYISNGLGQALFHLINHAPIFQSGTLLQFVQRVRKDEPDTKIIFTGHGIGGALASSLAYALAKAGVLGSTPSSNAYVYPTGAPSPGNLAFAQTFSKYFPSPEEPLEGYQHWNVNIVNRLDIVPYAFCTDTNSEFTLNKIAGIYQNPEHRGSELSGVKLFVKKLTEKARGLYYPLKSSTFVSPVRRPPISPNSTIGFLFSAGQQHVSAYKAYILTNRDQSEKGLGNK